MPDDARSLGETTRCVIDVPDEGRNALLHELRVVADNGATDDRSVTVDVLGGVVHNTSAPCSSGRCSAGVANVLSTRTRAPWAWWPFRRPFTTCFGLASPLRPTASLCTHRGAVPDGREGLFDLDEDLGVIDRCGHLPLFTIGDLAHRAAESLA